MEPIKVLIVEDVATTRAYLTELIQIMGYHVHAVERKAEFVTELRGYRPDLLLLGSSFKGGQIKAFAEVLEREKPRTPIVYFQDGLEASHLDQFPDSSNVRSLPNHFDSEDLKGAIERLVAVPAGSGLEKLDKTIVGQAPAMMQLKRHIARLSQSDVTVLISGESGTGKELAARAIHTLSHRARKPFVKVNCAALPSNLLESELFGFEKGAFTGAYHKKPGKFELAHSGTIFLDEISELPLPMQAKLLQVLQDDEVSALGSTANISIDSRVIAATNADVSKMVSEGLFRSDLYFRINVVSMSIPPLRERREDIPVLCEHFLKKYALQYGDQFRPIKQEVIERLHEHHWPGNVRELQNFIQGAAVLGEAGRFYQNIGSNGLDKIALNGGQAKPSARPNANDPAVASAKRPLKEVCRRAARKAETEVIVDALLYTNWNRRKAAELLQVSYKALLNKVKEYEIEDRYGEILKKGQVL
jgi:two-component system response regulator AtoC